MTRLANTLDYSSLAQPVTTADINLAKGDATATRQGRTGPWSGTWNAVATLLLLFGAIFLVVGLVTQTGGRASMGVVFLFIGAITLYLLLSSASDAKRLARMSRFAHANGITYFQNDISPVRTGLIFTVGHSRSISQALILADDTEIGNYQYTVGSGKHRVTHYWSYVRIQLPRTLPHMVLDARLNNFLSKFSNLPTGFDRSQVLSLEGDFDQHFTLYAPDTYKTDALYIFTPDVMATMIDAGRAYDMEIIDDTLLLYTKQRLVLDSKTILEPLFAVIDVISSEVNQQGSRYRDERSNSTTSTIAANIPTSSPLTIADPGRRLRTRPSTTTVLTIVAIVVWIIVTVIT